MQNNNNNILYAGFFVRLSAYVIDCIIVGLILLIIKIPKLFMTLMNPDIFLVKPLLFKFSLMDIVLYLLTLTYFVLMTYFFGATLGKKLLKIKVCKSDNKKLSFVDVLYRESIGRYLSTLIIFIGYIMIAVDSEKRGLHDILCDTVVVYDFEKKTYVKNNPEQYFEVQPVIKNIKVDNQVYNENDFLKDNNMQDTEISTDFNKDMEDTKIIDNELNKEE